MDYNVHTAVSGMKECARKLLLTEPEEVDTKPSFWQFTKPSDQKNEKRVNGGLKERNLIPMSNRLSGDIELPHTPLTGLS
jgi:hypothetical protein